MKKLYCLNRSGQALVEYLFVLMFLVVISTKLVGSFTDFMRDSFGNFAHVLTTNLMTGTCKNQCFF
ncbi:MAG: hypothetical protein WEB87_06895, partial [Bacteriovoracaceae bacterium]